MWDIISMWKNPKMIALVLLTAFLYAALIFPVQEFKILGGHGDFGRVGIGVPIAFSFLFGPAAAWGAAIGNVFRDSISTSGLTVRSIFGFAGNFLIGYLPYKLWTAITSEKPDLRSIKKFSVFAGISVLACTVCGLVIGWGIDWSTSTRFMPLSFIITISNLLWAIVAGSILLAILYGYVSKHRMLYTDILNKPANQARWSKTRSAAILTFAVSTILVFYIGQSFDVDAFVLLPFVAASIISAGIACR